MLGEKQLLIVVFWFFAAVAGQAQRPFDCNGRMFRVIEEQGGTTLQEIKVDYAPLDIAFEDLKFFSGEKINGICYRPDDNFIYGVTLGGKYNLVRIDANYQLTYLKELPLPEHMLFVSGDVSPDGKYLVLLGFSAGESTNLLALVDLSTPEHTTQLIPMKTEGDVPSIYCADVAFHPTTHKLYGFDHRQNRLILLDLEERLIQNTAFEPVDNLDGNAPSMFFDPRGNLFAVASPQEGLSGRGWFQFDTETGAVTELDAFGYQGNQDACSCPYKVNLRNQVSSRTAFRCTELDFTLTVINRSPLIQERISLRDTFPEGTIIKEVHKNPFGGRLSFPAPNILVIDQMTLPIGEDKIELTLDISEAVPTGVYANQAHLYNINNILGDDGIQVVSDDPQTARAEDPTLFAVRLLEVDLGTDGLVLCRGDQLELNPDIRGNTEFRWSTGATSASIEVGEAGTYALTVTTACEEASGAVTVELDEVVLDLGEDIILEEGQSIVVTPDIRTGSPLTYYYWKPEGPALLDCLTCPEVEILPQESGILQLEIENANGCRTTDALALQLMPFQYYVPTAFSPDNDGINDRFYLMGRRSFPIEAFRVFDRWGNILYQTVNISANQEAGGWDGKYDGRYLDPAVYIWQAVIINSFGEEQVLAGEVNLLR